MHTYIIMTHLRSRTLSLPVIAACQPASRRRLNVARSCAKHDPERTAILCSQTLKNDTLTHPSLEAECCKQMETFQALSAFFVHDLKNLAAKLSLMLQNLPLYYDNPEFRDDALHVIAGSV